MNNFKDNTELFVGQKFRFRLNYFSSRAEIIEIYDDKVKVLLLDIRKATIIDKKIVEKMIPKSANIKVETAEIKKICKNCMLYFNGECCGEKDICSFFKNRPEISSEERSYWPKDGSVSRMKSDNCYVREYDGIYDKYTGEYY